MRLIDFPAESRANEKAFRLISYTLIALMMACAAWTFASVLNRLAPSWQPWYLAGVALLVTLERLYSRHLAKNWALLSSEWWISLGTQWVIILLVIKVIVGLSHGVEAFLQEIVKWIDYFHIYFFSPEYLVAVTIAVIAWLLGGYFAELIDEMGLAQALLERDASLSAPSQQPPARERLVSFYITIGTVLVLFTAIIRLDMRAFLGQTDISFFVELPALGGGGGSTLLYFVLGLALLSQTKFIDMHTFWNLQRIPVNRQLAVRWGLYSVIFLAIVAGVVSLLPTNYSMSLLTAVGYVLNFLSSLIFFIAQIVVSILVFLFNLPFLLFGKKSETNDIPAATPEPPQSPLAEIVGGSPIPWVELLKSLAFWGIFLAVLIFSIVQYLRQHQEVLEALRKIPGLAWLTRFWNWLRSAFRTAQKGISKAIVAGVKRMRPRQNLARELSGWINLRRLNPRQRVFFFYQALLRRSGESGLPRSLSQTPNEFATALDSAIPEAEPDIDAMTSAFVEARYTPLPVEPEKANRVREYWEHLRKALRGKRPEVESGK